MWSKSTFDRGGAFTRSYAPCLNTPAKTVCPTEFYSYTSKRQVQTNRTRIAEASSQGGIVLLRLVLGPILLSLS
jgi:hypothetical protein